MEKFLKPCDKEYMRMAMLKHEETLKEQICELHRLYRIQKIMMRNIESSRPNERNQELWRYSRPSQSNLARDMQQKSKVKLDLEWPAEDCVAESNADRIVEESEIQLTLGPSSYDTRKKPETPPLSSDSGPGRSSTSTGSSHLDRTKREELRGCESGLFQVPGMAMGYQSESSSGVEEQLRQERLKQPPWLCQVLSLNMA
ncbi:hypothetical protein OIU84_005883 [Salix udensis]|uniref:Uncharacterized protein n=1 Tax=Salix udensis TaxID=889485 RepID=A0AAD6JXY8_9ROSI|nr:hypothetical protein OIU84_005883 [Salix udensis]